MPLNHAAVDQRFANRLRCAIFYPPHLVPVRDDDFRIRDRREGAPGAGNGHKSTGNLTPWRHTLQLVGPVGWVGCLVIVQRGWDGTACINEALSCSVHNCVTCSGVPLYLPLYLPSQVLWEVTIESDNIRANRFQRELTGHRHIQGTKVVLARNIDVDEACTGGEDDRY